MESDLVILLQISQYLRVDYCGCSVCSDYHTQTGFTGLLHFDFHTGVGGNVGETNMLKVPDNKATLGGDTGEIHILQAFMKLQSL